MAKWFKSFAKTFVGKYVAPALLGMIPGVGPIAATAYGAARAGARDENMILGGLGGFGLGGVGAGLKNVISNIGTTGGLTGSVGAFKTGAGKYIQSTPLVGKSLSNLLGMGGATASGGTATAGASTGAGGGLNTSTILGLGLLGSSMLPKTPQFQQPESVGKLTEQILGKEGLTGIGKQARTNIGNILTAKPEELYPITSDAYYNAAIRRTEESYNQAQKDIDATYNRAGVLGSGEHSAARNKLSEEFARTKSGIAAESEQRRFELARQDKLTAIQQALNVDQQTMQDLVGITGLDVQQAAIKYGADVEDIRTIREILGYGGSLLLAKGSGLLS